MKLLHLPLRNLTPYLYAQSLQDRLVRSFLNAKASSSSTTTNSLPPTPTLITYTPPPTYTCGRREIARLTAAQKAKLTIPYTLPAIYASGKNGNRGKSSPGASTSNSTHSYGSTSAGAAPGTGTSTFYETLRGGQTTYHGPGQLVAYPVLDLRMHDLGVRAWVRTLEDAVIATVARYGIRGVRTDNPGVWVRRTGRESDGLREVDGADVEEEVLVQGYEEEKICALGVHLRRNVSSHGIALNVWNDPLWWLRRIVACGLEGVGVTSVAREMEISAIGGGDVREGRIEDTRPSVEEVGKIFVLELASRLHGVEGVQEIHEEDLPP